MALVSSRPKECERELTLPGELPFSLRRRHRYGHGYLADRASTSCSLWLNSTEDHVTVVTHDVQGNQESEGGGGDLFKIVDKLEEIIDRLTSSCGVKPKFDTCMDTERTSDLRNMEERLEKVICKLSQSGYFSRCHSQKSMKGSSRTVESESPARISSPEQGNVQPSPKAQTGNESDGVATPVSSFRVPLLTPRSLLLKFGSSEKADTLDLRTTPTSQRQSSGSRSRRLSAAFSFLYSPKKAGKLSP